MPELVGAGILFLPRTFADATGYFGALIAWCVAGTDMFMLARVFQALTERKPDLDAVVYVGRYEARYRYKNNYSIRVVKYENHKSRVYAEKLWDVTSHRRLGRDGSGALTVLYLRS